MWKRTQYKNHSIIKTTITFLKIYIMWTSKQLEEIRPNV